MRTAKASHRHGTRLCRLAGLTATRTGEMMAVMWSWAAIAAVLVPLAVPAVTLGAAPLAGAHYAGHTNDARSDTRIAVNLTVTDDGGEFARPSFFAAQVKCQRYDAQEDLTLDWSVREPPTRVRTDGGFRLRDRHTGSSVVGRFIRGGRIATGTVDLRRRPTSARCPRLHAQFRIGIVGLHPRRPRGVFVCDRVRVSYSQPLDNDEAYRVVDHGRGCTAARADARRFRRSASCQTLSVGATCTIAQATCQAIRGGSYSQRASVRCWTTNRPQHDAELTHYVPCPPPSEPSYDGRIYAWGVNVDCATVAAFPLGQLLGNPETEQAGACGWPEELSMKRRRSCRPFGGYGCSARRVAISLDGGTLADCQQIADRFRVVLIALG